MKVSTNLNYQEIKESIRKDLNGVAERFVSVGYHLKQVRDNELYKQDGYKDICEFALKEYGIGKSNTYYFMNINDKFSVGGNSPELIPEYEGYGSSKLTEMLTLDEEELKLVSDNTTRDEVREINQAKKEAKSNFQPAGNAEMIDSTQTEVKPDDTGKDVLKEFAFEYFNEEGKRNELIELGKINRKIPPNIIKEIQEIINPSGHTMIRKSLIIAFLEWDSIKLKKFGGKTYEFSYRAFLEAAGEIFDLTEGDPWAKYFGEPEKKIEEETEEQEEQEQITEPSTEPEQPQKALEGIPGQADIRDYPECLPDATEKAAEEIIHSCIEETNRTEELQEEIKELEGPRIHDLKTDHIYFADVLRNIKPFELRYNDRDFRVGDILRLHEQIDGQQTGRIVDREVIYILENYAGLVKGFCILGIQLV